MFTFPDHQGNYEFLLKADRTNSKDFERKAMFYLFAGSDEIMARIDELYNFDERMICIDDIHKAVLSSGSRALMMLGYNLYNNYPCGTIMDIFRNLDERNCELALKGIRIRLGKE